MREIKYMNDPYGNTLVFVGGRELATKVDVSMMVAIIKEHGSSARTFVETTIKDTLARDMHLNLLQEEKDLILSELMVQIDEAGRKVS